MKSRTILVYLVLVIIVLALAAIAANAAPPHTEQGVIAVDVNAVTTEGLWYDPAGDTWLYGTLPDIAEQFTWPDVFDGRPLPPIANSPPQ